MSKLSKVEFFTELRKRKFFQDDDFGKTLLDDVETNHMAALRTTKMCFVAGTKIHAQQGLVNIEDIKPGMMVLARDEQNTTQSFKPVLQTFVTKPTLLYHLYYTINGGEADDEDPELISGTGEHPFWVVGKQKFVPVKDLKVGDVFRLANGEFATLAKIGTEKAVHGETFTTYNFEVADYHTYFAGDSGLWVHNMGRTLCEQLYSVFEKYIKINDDLWVGLDKSVAWVNKKKTFIDKKLAHLKLINKSRSKYFSELAKGNSPSRARWHDLTGQKLAGDKIGDSGNLGRNIEKKYGITKVPDMAAHHIVEKRDNPFGLDILKKHEIDVDEIANGVFLKRKAIVTRYETDGNGDWLDGTGVVHEGPHT
ncbi:hypothetical protein LNTAR_18415, partial [Lentisphaera araneosa HTCC2155]